MASDEVLKDFYADEIARLTDENARLAGQVAALREAGQALASALDAFNVDVSALYEVVEFVRERGHEPDDTYPIDGFDLGDYRAVGPALAAWRAALAAAGGEYLPSPEQSEIERLARIVMIHIDDVAALHALLGMRAPWERKDADG